MGTGLGGGVGSGDWEMEKVPDQNLFPVPGAGEGQVVGGGASNIELSSSESPSHASVMSETSPMKIAWKS